MFTAMGIVRIGIVVDSNKDALCFDLRHEMGETGDLRKSKWEIIPQEQQAETCSKCPLAWNNGSCEGRCGSCSLRLPNLAKRFGLEIIAGIPKAHEESRV